MNTVSSVQVASLAMPTMRFGAPVAAASLMPEPSVPLDASGGDPMAALYAIMAKQRTNDMASGKAGVEHNHEMQKAQMLKEQEDFKKQEDAKNSAAAWGIFGKIASIVAIAVSAVVSAVSCGAASALCAGACALSAAAFVEGETHCLAKMTGDPNVGKWFQMGCGIGAALCSGGAGLAATGAGIVGQVAEVAGSACKIGQEVISNTSTDKNWGYVAMALGVAGSVGDVTFAASAALNAASSVASGVGTAVKECLDGVQSTTSLVQTVKVAAAVTSFAAGVSGGVATIVSSQYQADSINDDADAKQAQMRIAHLQQLTSWAIDGIKETDKSHERALGTLQGAMQTKGQTLVVASAMKV
jgi:hypothetical protein